MELAVVLVSGGIDSCVLTSIARQDNTLAMLHISYGQAAQQQELKAFDKQVEYFEPERVLKIAMPHFAAIGGSSLVDKRLPIETPSELGGQIPHTYLPFGYPTFWSVATAWAEVIGAGKVYFGAVADHGVQAHAAGKIEPAFDRECFYLFGQLAQFAGKPDMNIKFETPLYGLTRREILTLAQQVDSPLDLTWSCYRSDSQPCLQCYRCLIRKVGFHQVTMTDPATDFSESETTEPGR